MHLRWGEGREGGTEYCSVVRVVVSHGWLVYEHRPRPLIGSVVLIATCLYTLFSVSGSEWVERLTEWLAGIVVSLGIQGINIPL